MGVVAGRRGLAGWLLVVALVAAVAMTGAAIGATAVAQEGGEGAATDSPPGEPLREGRLVAAGGGFDPAILTVFVPGTEFNPYQGSSLEADLVRYESPDSNCVSADAGAGGVLTELRAGVYVPDGSRIKRLVFYGQDSDGTSDIGIRLSRGTVNVPTAGAPTRTFTLVDAFATSGAPGVVAVAGADALDSLAGPVPVAGGGTDHHFHTIHVQLWNSSSTNHRLCGVEVEYQVPAFHGIGTGSPQAQLHVTNSDGTAQLLVTETNATVAARQLFRLENTGSVRFLMADNAADIKWQFQIGNNGAFAISRQGTGGPEFQVFEDGSMAVGAGATQNLFLDPDGNLTIAGDFTANGMPGIPTLAAADQAIRDQVSALAAENQALRDRVGDLEAQVAGMADLEARLAAMEAKLAQLTDG